MAFRLRRSLVTLAALAAVLVSLVGVGPGGPVGALAGGGGCGCCADCGDGCACPLPPLDEGGHGDKGDLTAGPRLSGPVVSSACGGCPKAVGSSPSHRLDAPEVRVAARGERPGPTGRAFETRSSLRTAEPCPEISPRAPPASRV